MNISTDIKSFLNETAKGAACVRIKTADLMNDLVIISDGLHDWYSPNDFAQIFQTTLRGLCPECNVWTRGETFGVFALHKRAVRTGISTTEGSPKSRLMHGHCPNVNCNASEIFLIWRGDNLLLYRIKKYLEQALVDPKYKRYKDMLEEPNVLAVTADTVWGIQQRCKEDKLFHIHYQFPELILWVSVVPAPRQMFPLYYPGGYIPYFDQLGAVSKNFREDHVFAHWMAFREGEEWIFALAFISEKNLPAEEQQLVLPADLVSQAQIDEILKGVR